MVDVDWKALRENARGSSTRAYAPYSRFPVGAAGLVDDGRLVRGCNVENVSYGLGVCAEVSLTSDLISGGGGRLVAVSVADRDQNVIMPCGRCRQVLLEHGGGGLLIDHPHGPRPLADLLPEAFSAADLGLDR